MLIPYQSLQELPVETLDALIMDYLYQQVEDGNLANLDSDSKAAARSKVKALLKRGELVVEYAEESESIAIKAPSDLLGS
ncbi:YheU family protein [Paraferrimonas sedimenticola]|uniref:YheU family protein n=1 Tax=Paraferrimonas sedimenticola TaxID=375674 RepID=A0AA37VUC3_9GAMM|nr:YheU family protein [Paraferrimonas sedimenticola]GLP95784.1 hypothetical protein GCM10007895_10900 [Paraferrimonas sedimenticola]